MKTKIENTLIKSLMLLGMIAGTSAVVSAQEYKLSKSTGKLEIRELNDVTIEGHNGNEIIFTSVNYAAERDERAEGLRVINSLGLEDNTGIGLSVVDKGSTIEVYQLKRMDGPKVKIMVPRAVVVSYSHTSPHGEDIYIKNVESEIELSTVHNGVHLTNVTGPITAKTVHGEIEIEFNPNMKSPVSLASAHGLVDVTMPVAAKANLSMRAGHGEIFVDPAFKIEMEKQSEWTVYGSGTVDGKLNGGGLDVSLSTSHGNIYLRKK